MEPDDKKHRDENTGYRFPITMFMLGSMLFVIIANTLYGLYSVLFR